MESDAQKIHRLETEIEQLRARIQIQAPEDYSGAYESREFPECDCGGQLVPVQLWKCVKKCCQHEVKA